MFSTGTIVPERNITGSSPKTDRNSACWRFFERLAMTTPMPMLPSMKAAETR